MTLPKINSNFSKNFKIPRAIPETLFRLGIRRKHRITSTTKARRVNNNNGRYDGYYANTLSTRVFRQHERRGGCITHIVVFYQNGNNARVI